MLIVVPAVAMGAVALALQGRVDGPIAAGAVALAVVPAPLLAPELVGRMRGRADLAGALALGTVLVSLLVVGSRGALASGALFVATEAFTISAMVANGLPTVRDAVLLPLRLVGWAGVVLVFATAVASWSALVATPRAGAEQPSLLASFAVALGLFLVGVVTSAGLARVTDRGVSAAVGGAGLRDPALAVALSWVIAGPEATLVPLLYAVLCLGLAALAFRAHAIER